MPPEVHVAAPQKAGENYARDRDDANKLDSVYGFQVIVCHTRSCMLLRFHARAFAETVQEGHVVNLEKKQNRHRVQAHIFYIPTVIQYKLRD